MNDAVTEKMANGDELYPDATKNKNNDPDCDVAKREVGNKTMEVWNGISKDRNTQ